MNKRTIDKEDLDYLKKLAIKSVETESYVVDRIIDIEAKHDLEDETDYMDEGEQAELGILYDILGRDLDEFENNRLEDLRKVYLGEVETIDEAVSGWASRMRHDVDSTILKDVRIEAIKRIQ